MHRYAIFRIDHFFLYDKVDIYYNAGQTWDPLCEKLWISSSNVLIFVQLAVTFQICFVIDYLPFGYI